MKTIKECIGANPYPGRGILVGKTTDNKAVIAYFISGRSEHSRNRIFKEDEKGHIYTRPFLVASISLGFAFNSAAISFPFSSIFPK